MLRADQLTIPVELVAGRTGPHVSTSATRRRDGTSGSLPISGERKPVPFATAAFNELTPALSPDGRFLVYTSNESGRNEIYVQSFPGPGGKWQISNAGGTDPHWRADGKELFYRAPTRSSWPSTIHDGDTLQAGVPQALFPGRVTSATRATSSSPPPTASAFSSSRRSARDSMTPTTVVLNWFAALEK